MVGHSEQSVATPQTTWLSGHAIRTSKEIVAWSRLTIYHSEGVDPTCTSFLNVIKPDCLISRETEAMGNLPLVADRQSSHIKVTATPGKSSSINESAQHY